MNDNAVVNNKMKRMTDPLLYINLIDNYAMDNFSATDSFDNIVLQI